MPVPAATPLISPPPFVPLDAPTPRFVSSGNATSFPEICQLMPPVLALPVVVVVLLLGTGDSRRSICSMVCRLLPSLEGVRRPFTCHVEKTISSTVVRTKMTIARLAQRFRLVNIIAVWRALDLGNNLPQAPRSSQDYAFKSRTQVTRGLVQDGGNSRLSACSAATRSSFPCCRSKCSKLQEPQHQL